MAIVSKSICNPILLYYKVSSDKDNNKEIIGCADLATNIFNSATSESAIIFRENKHTFIKQNTRHTDPVKWRIPCDMISSFDKKQYLYPIITRIPSAPPYSLCLSRWYPMLPDKSKSFFRIMSHPFTYHRKRNMFASGNTGP